MPIWLSAYWTSPEQSNDDGPSPPHTYGSELYCCTDAAKAVPVSAVAVFVVMLLPLHPRLRAQLQASLCWFR